MNDSPQCEDFWSPRPRRGAVIVYDPAFRLTPALLPVGGYYAQLFEEASEFSSPCPVGKPSPTFFTRQAAVVWARFRDAMELLYR